MRQVKQAVHSIVLTLRAILAASVGLGHLVSDETDSGAFSVKPFIDNMIHVIMECLRGFPTCLDSDFFNSFLEPLPTKLRSLCGNFHPLTHVQLDDPKKQKIFEGQTRSITRALSELPLQCSSLELFMTANDAVLKQVSQIKYDLQRPTRTLMDHIRSLQWKEKNIISEMAISVKATSDTLSEEAAMQLADAVLLLLPVWRIASIIHERSREFAKEVRFDSEAEKRLVERFVAHMQSEQIFKAFKTWQAAEFTLALKLCLKEEVLAWAFPNGSDVREFDHLRSLKLDSIDRAFDLWRTLPPDVAAKLTQTWRNVGREIHCYREGYVRLLQEFLATRKLIREICIFYLYIPAWLSFPAVNLLPCEPDGPCSVYIPVESC